MTTQTLNNKVALITGGTTGIGLATAKRFVEAGADLIVTGRNPETLEAARKTLGDGVEVIASDAGDPKAIEALFAHIKKTRGRLDVLFLNAGIAKFGPLSDLPLETAEQTLKINLLGPWFALKAASPLLEEGSSVIFNTSSANTKGIPGATIYSATKAGLRSLVRTAAAELSERKIRVNAISPGPIETPIFNKLDMPKEALDGFATEMTAQVPLGRFGSADEIAKATLFLASDNASFVNGAELVADGGLSQV